MREKTIFQVMVEEEYERSLRVIEVYTEEIKKYPKGNLQIKKQGNKEYYYLIYRDENSKIVSEYVGCDMDDICEIKKKINMRKQKEKAIKQLKLGIKEMEYMLAYKGWKE